MKTCNHSPKTCGAGACAGPLSAYLEAFCLKDEALGYSPVIRARHRHLLEQLNLWLESSGQGLEDINEHLVECFAQGTGCHRKEGARTTLRLFLELLREAGVIGPAQLEKPSCPVGALVREYTDFLINECGLAGKTAFIRARHVGRFLSVRFGARPVHLTQLRAQEVIDFVRDNVRGLSRSHASQLAASLRSFFRFARQRGNLNADLLASVPRVAGWKLSVLPKSLPPGGAEQALRCCERKSAQGMRDYAILMLLARLGLRAGEVVALRLEDIDWARAQLTVRSKKGGVWCRLPMCREVGEALACYLKNARPKCASRHVFVRVDKAPLKEFSCTGAIGYIVRRALDRAGVDSARKGSHVFRHTLAGELLKNGASLEQIGRILRHKGPDATAIYAKVDLESLRALAMPWIGGAP
ncbi:MAG: site-specific integrase [Kiritimatiellaeota bacterium]|nr:site-specific integrase [Kiritimatiellota bacterium]